MLLGSSLILMENGEWRRLDSLQFGERVACLDDQRRMTATEVSGKHCHGEHRALKLSTHQGRQLRASRDLSLLAVDSFTALDALLPGDWVLAKFDDGRIGWDAIEAIEPLETVLLFSLDTRTHGNFIAEGLVVRV